MRYREPFGLFKRQLASGLRVYYYVVYDELGRRKQYSTGQKTKAAARIHCLNLFRRNALLPLEEITFGEFAKDFFDYHKCPYIQNRLLRGHTHSRSYADTQRHRLLVEILPEFAKARMNAITTRSIEAWLLRLKTKKKSNLTINHSLSTIKVIFAEALRTGTIRSNPALAVKGLSQKYQKRYVPLEKEIQKLLDPSTLDTVWNGLPLYYTITRLAAETGMRMGEIQALHREDLHPDHIVVTHSWDRKYGLKGTKTGTTRIIPIKPELFELIRQWDSQNTNGPYVFSADCWLPESCEL